MPYRMKTEGLEEFGKMLKECEEHAEWIASWSLFDGAGVMADAVTKEAKSIKTEPFHYAAVEGVTTRLPSPEEKQILLDSGAMGISKFKKRLGAVDTSVGYNSSGYALVNWRHMSSKARTNYKAQPFKNKDFMTTSTLKAAGVYKRGAQNAKPIGVIANAINSGTSFMKKQPFIRRAVTKATPAAIDAIIKRAESMMQNIIQKNETGGKSA